MDATSVTLTEEVHLAQVKPQSYGGEWRVNVQLVDSSLTSGTPTVSQFVHTLPQIFESQVTTISALYSLKVAGLQKK